MTSLLVTSLPKFLKKWRTDGSNCKWEWGFWFQIKKLRNSKWWRHKRFWWRHLSRVLTVSLLQADYPPSTLLISKYGLTDLSSPFLVPVVLECTSHVSNGNTSNSLSFSTGPIASSFTSETFALKQGLDWCTSHLMTCKFQSVLFLTDSQSPPLISCLSRSGRFGPSPSPSPATPPWASNGSPVTQVSPSVKKQIYLPKLVPPCPLTQSHALSPQSLPKSVIPSTTIGDVTSPTSIWISKSPKSLQRNCSFLAPFAVSFPVFAAMATVFFYPRIFTGSVGRRILLVVPVDTLYRTSIISSLTVLPLNPFVNLSSAPLSLFLTYGPDLGVWPTVGSPRSSSAPPSLERGRVVPPPPVLTVNLK